MLLYVRRLGEIQFFRQKMSPEKIRDYILYTGTLLGYNLVTDIRLGIFRTSVWPTRNSFTSDSVQGTPSALTWSLKLSLRHISPEPEHSATCGGNRSLVSKVGSRSLYRPCQRSTKSTGSITGHHCYRRLYCLLPIVLSLPPVWEL